MDIEKAYANVRWERDKFFHIMEKVSLDFKDRKIMHKLYFNERAVINKDNEAYEDTKIQKGVQQ